MRRREAPAPVLCGCRTRPLSRGADPGWRWVWAGGCSGLGAGLVPLSVRGRVQASLGPCRRRCVSSARWRGLGPLPCSFSAGPGHQRPRPARSTERPQELRTPAARLSLHQTGEGPDPGPTRGPRGGRPHPAPGGHRRGRRPHPPSVGVWTGGQLGPGRTPNRARGFTTAETLNTLQTAAPVGRGKPSLFSGYSNTLSK